MSVPPFDAAESIEKEQVAVDFEPRLGKGIYGVGNINRLSEPVF
jgi:hypothetical protein